MHEILPCRNGNVSRKCFGALFFLAFLLAGNYGYSQVGTTCENPIVISALPYTTTDDTANYADNYDPSEASDPECETTSSGNSYHTGNDVIYSYTPATDTSIDIEMPDGVAWSGMFVYADCADIGLVYAACATSTSSGDRIINDFPVVGGQTYYILLSIWETPQTYAYTLNVTENTCTEHSVVFDVVADCDNGEQFMVTAEVTNMGSATSITVTDNQGSAPQELTAAGTLTFGPYENLTEVVLTAANTGDGNCVVVSDELTQAACPPANDDCSGAIALTVNPDYSCATVTSGTTLGATELMESGACSGDPDDDVWFTFVAEASEHVITLSNIVAVDGDEDDDDMYIQVLSGSCDGEMTSVKCSDPEATTVTGLTTGETYYVRVYSYYDDARQTFDICVGTAPDAPANDDCTGAVSLTVNDDLECAAVTQGTTAGATESMAAAPCNGNPDDDVWYSFVAEQNAHVIKLSDRVAVAGTSIDMYFQVLSGACGTEMTSVKCSDPEESLVGGLTAGETYYVRVYTYQNTSKVNFSICVGTPPPPPANDECANAVTLTVGEDFESAAVATTNAWATHNDEDPVPSCDASGFATNGKDVWFTVVVPASGSVTIETGSNDDEGIDDTGLAVYSGTCGDITALDCNSDDGEGNFSFLEFTGLTPSETLLVRAWGYSTDAGSFKIAAYDTCNAAAPAGNEEQTLETGQTLANLDVTGGELTWYSDEALTTEIPATTVVVDGTTYYVTQVVDECISPALAVTVAVVDPCAGILAPEAAEEQTLEPGQTLADLEVTGEELTWYSDEALTTEIPATTVAVDGTTYYVTQTVGECTSTATDITVSVVDPCAGVLAPEAPAAQTLEPGQTLAELDVTGENFTWYSDEALTTEIPATTVAVDGTTYYVTQTVGECTSAATGITVAVVDPCAGVLAPAGNEEQQFNTGETLADLDVTGENLTWYADEALTTELPATTVLVNDTTYYVTQTVGECVSAALAVTVSEILGTEGLDKASFRYYPNPAADVLTLSYAEEITNVTVYNMLGQPVISTALNATEGTVDVSRLASGSYLVKVEAGNAATTVKIVKN